MSPRPLRPQAAGAVYHVYAQATGSELLHRDAADCERFLWILRGTVKAYALDLHFFVVMGTHYHLLLTTTLPNISAAMQHLNSRYCQTYNLRHERKGHVLRGRFGTSLVESDRHATRLVSYLALNPVSAGLVERPEDWPWSTYASLVGLAPGWDFVNPDFILRSFAPDPARAAVLVREYVESVLAQEADQAYAGASPSSVASGRAKKRKGTNVVPRPGETWSVVPERT